MSPGKNPADRGEKDLKVVYQELCNSYRAIDDFRAKLLGFLPLASGTGIFLLVKDETAFEKAKPYFWAIGLFGFAITLGLFFYEIYGIRICTYLIETGKKLEGNMGFNKYAQFKNRPSGVCNDLINEPLAAGVIYPAVLVAWVFLAFVFEPPQWCNAESLAFGTFFSGLIFSLYFKYWLGKDVEREFSDGTSQKK